MATAMCYVKRLQNHCHVSRMCALEKELKRVKQRVLVPLTKSGTAVGTPSLAQGEAEQDPQREEENGAQDAQASEVIFQNAHPAGWTATNHHY